MIALPPRTRTLVVWLLKATVVALLVWGVHATLMHALTELDRHTWKVEPAWLVLSACLYLASLLPPAIFWHRLMLGCGQQVFRTDAVRAFYASQLGKYVPGKAIVIVVRAGLVRRHRPDTTVVVATVFLETLTTMAVGSLMALVIAVVWFRELSVTAQFWPVGTVHIPLAVVAALMLLATGLPTLPPVLKRLVRSLGIGKISSSAVEQLSAIKLRTLAAGWVLVAIGWLLQGASMWATLRALGADAGNPLQQLPLHTAAVALAVVAGFLAFLPGGLGVREIVLVPLLAPRYGAPTALVAALILRLVWLVAEVVVSAILYVLRPYRLSGTRVQNGQAADEPLAAS